MPPVPIPRRPERAPATPEELYDRLTVTDTAIGALWRHQSHVLGRYFDDHANSADVALELPTGAGKTLVGLLIADWRRQKLKRPSAFLCPTRQLAQQAFDKASGYGIPAVLLTGSHRRWDAGDKTRGLTAEATIISTYSHIFNASPKLTPATLVLDDAHAAEGFVAENWSLSIDRGHAAYELLVNAIADLLNPQVVDDIHNDELVPTGRPTPKLVGPSDLAARGPKLLEILDSTIAFGDAESFALSEIRGHLGGCVMYVGWGELMMRPFVPPTRFHPAFEDAEQRVYLSATLGAAGEIERSFGRTKVPRVAMPSDWERHGSGRRLVLLPGAGMAGGDAVEFIKSTMRAAGRALVLVPSKRQAIEVMPLVPQEWTTLTQDTVNDRLEPFPTTHGCALVLANRYDGIDLPGETCKMILIAGLPAGTHMQERFLFDTAEARSALRERMRTRLMQGMGRATRSRSERAIVLLAGEDLLMFVRDPGNIAGLRPELHAELEYGLFLASEGHPLAETVESFLTGGEEWASAEQYLREEADAADLSAPAGAEALQLAAAEEVLACEAAWRGAPGEATMHAQAAVRRLTVQAVAGYRTVWKVLAAHWAAQHARITGDPLDIRVAAELSRDAASSARVRAWRPILPKVTVATAAAALDSRGVRIAERLVPLSRSPRVDRYIGELEADIGEDEYRSFERGLLRLGEMLGYDAVRPGTKAAPDGAWRDGDDQILWEAKSEQLSGGGISPKIVRQASTHPTWIERELDWEKVESPTTFLVSPRTDVDSEAISVVAEHVWLCSLTSVRQLANELANLWKELLSRVQGLTPSEVAVLAGHELEARGLRTADLHARLGARQVASFGQTPAIDLSGEE